ncbi:MAG: hypothetical protein AAFP90_22295 [Planctomycetota bacterium]
MITLLRVFLLICIPIGVYFSVSTMTRNQSLREERARLLPLAGELIIQDPTKVHVSLVYAPSRDDLRNAANSDDAIRLIWKFRTYVPKGFDAMRINATGTIAADSPYRTGGHGSSFGQPTSEALSKMVVFALTQGPIQPGRPNERFQLVHTDVDGQSSYTLKITDRQWLTDAVVDLVSDVPQKTVAMDADKPFIMFRMRAATPKKNTRPGMPKTYPGYYCAVVPRTKIAQWETVMDTPPTKDATSGEFDER